MYWWKKLVFNNANWSENLVWPKGVGGTSAIPELADRRLLRVVFRERLHSVVVCERVKEWESVWERKRARVCKRSPPHFVFVLKRRKMLCFWSQYKLRLPHGVPHSGLQRHFVSNPWPISKSTIGFYGGPFVGTWGFCHGHPNRTLFHASSTITHLATNRNLVVQPPGFRSWQDV